jgi:hypothetical protein
MVNPVSFDPKMAAESAKEMGSLLQGAFNAKTGAVNDMLSMQAQAIQQSAASAEGMGENYDSYA